MSDYYNLEFGSITERYTRVRKEDIIKILSAAETYRCSGGFVILTAKSRLSIDSEFSFYSKIFGKIAGVDQWKNHLLRKTEPGNIYITLTDGRIVPLYDPGKLSDECFTLSGEIMKEFDKNSYMTDYDYSNHEFAYHLALYSESDDDDVQRLDREINEEMERRRQAEISYHFRMAERERKASEEAARKAEEKEKLAEKRKNLNKMFE